MKNGHAELVEKAARWLHAQGYYVIIAEMGSGMSETPDAIGWKGTSTTLIECKTTRSDFAKDRKKWFRLHETDGMGDQRYYLTPPGLLRWQELPTGWGLLEPSGRGLRRVLYPSSMYKAKNHRAEAGLLVSAMRRIGRAGLVPGTFAQAVSVRPYVYDSKNRAALWIAAEPEA
jgi:hypothetical protein